MAPRWKSKEAEAKARLDPMSTVVSHLSATLLLSNTQSLLSGSAVVLCIEEEELKNLLVRSCFGKPITNADQGKQWFQLGLEEAFYLSYCLNCITVVGPDKCLMNNVELWGYMKSRKRDIPKLCKAFFHLRLKNWVVRYGYQYGVDFVAYRHHPSLVHSEYAVIVLSDDRDDNDGRLKVWSDFHCTVRLCGSVAKTLLVLYVKRNSGDTELPSCLDRFSVEERIVTRWNPERSREDQGTSEDRSTK